MSARSSARTFSARASFSAVRERCSQGASTTASPARASSVMARTCGSCGELVVLRHDEAERRPDQTEPDDHPDEGRPAAAGHERGEPDPAAGLGPPPLLRGGVGLPPHQRGAGAGEGDRPEEPLRHPEPARLDEPEQPGAERGQREDGAPVHRPPPRLAVRAAARCGSPTPGPGASTVLAAGISSQRAPYARTPKSCARARPTKTIRTTRTGQPKYCASPVQTPPRTAPSLTRTARRTGGADALRPGPARRSGPGGPRPGRG